jgi:alkylation response protein AidB-like acyl-CoA dehydrogenase
VSAIAETPERAQLRQAVRRCLERSAGPRAFLAEHPSGRWFDPDLLRTLTGQLDVAALVVPDSAGGAGGAMADLVAVFEELGAGLAPVPLFATIGLAVGALLALERDETADDLLLEIAQGHLIATTADIGPGFASDTPLTASRTEAGDWQVSGRRSVVVEGAGADVILVAAHGADPGDGLTLFAIPTDSAAVRRHAVSSLDLLRGFAAVDFVDAPASMLGAPGAWSAARESAWDLACVVLAAEQVGGAQRCLDRAVDYAKQRVQFGHHIGSFQAVQHRLVDLLLEVETARSTLLFAADAADGWLAHREPDAASSLTGAASMAKFTCSDAYLTVAGGALHIHGGIGFTWEHDSHLYFRRAKASASMLGTPALHRDRFAISSGL